MASDTRSDLLDGAQGGCIQHVGTGSLIGLQASDGVVEIRILQPEVVLGAAREGEGKVETIGRLTRSRDSLGRVVDLVDPVIGVVVLDRAPDRARFRNPRDGPRGIRRRRPEAVFEIDGHRQARGRVEDAHVVDQLVERLLSVQAPEREREARARGREGLEAEAREHLGRPGIPGIGNDEWLAQVQVAERFALLLAGSSRRGL